MNDLNIPSAPLRVYAGSRRLVSSRLSASGHWYDGDVRLIYYLANVADIHTSVSPDLILRRRRKKRRIGWRPEEREIIEILSDSEQDSVESVDRRSTRTTVHAQAATSSRTSSLTLVGSREIIDLTGLSESPPPTGGSAKQSQGSTRSRKRAAPLSSPMSSQSGRVRSSFLAISHSH